MPNPRAAIPGLTPLSTGPPINDMAPAQEQAVLQRHARLPGRLNHQARFRLAWDAHLSRCQQEAVAR